MKRILLSGQRPRVSFHLSRLVPHDCKVLDIHAIGAIVMDMVLNELSAMTREEILELDPNAIFDDDGEL